MCFVSFFVTAAIYNLTNHRVVSQVTLVLSVAWLLLVSVGLFTAISDEHGLRGFAVSQLSMFSHDHFVDVRPRDEGVLWIRFCFTLFARVFARLEVPATDIVSIRWNTGQATALAGRDMDDWLVWVTYRRKGAKRWTASGYREEAVFAVGVCGPKEQTETLGRALLAHLRSSGLRLSESSRSNEFIVEWPKQT